MSKLIKLYQDLLIRMGLREQPKPPVRRKTQHKDLAAQLRQELREIYHDR